MGMTTGRIFAHTGVTLSGQWSCRLDPQRVGENEKWFEQAAGIKVRLPGSTDENRLGRRNEKKSHFVQSDPSED